MRGGPARSAEYERRQFKWYCHPANRRFRQAVANLDAIIYETIAKRRRGETQGNDLLALLQWLTHRDPRWFDDPKSFRRERWDNDLARQIPRCAYFRFGDGPRICIGNHFAMMEAVWNLFCWHRLSS